METHRIIITYHECASQYELSENDVRGFVELGLLEAGPGPDTIRDEPDHLARLARLHHELGLSQEGIDVVLAMRQRLLHLQAELAYQRGRARQLEHLLRSSGPLLDADDLLAS
ncbi:hypothetical protein [Hymenobacter psychrotolerans]|uniref:Chaperone modulatory protein CbpM n=1 Tax=Hymenobacter psychrotolerans DSM 18569 TaxID=1121959 RepID=A0A1M7CCC4_9BACT|nr:hypothetical protein [Hymenobacter psychrotolerans]SHL64843.1 chaperone modulatory protein CbpM [Hymenobacter psychrotolerans DSM 18569]